jgi:hypothetical protein
MEIYKKLSVDDADKYGDVELINSEEAPARTVPSFAPTNKLGEQVTFKSSTFGNKITKYVTTETGQKYVAKIMSPLGVAENNRMSESEKMTKCFALINSYRSLMQSPSTTPEVFTKKVSYIFKKLQKFNFSALDIGEIVQE